MRRIFFIFVLLASFSCCYAQFNVEKVLASAEVALHYEDYPLSIAYDNQILALRPYLYKPWQLRGAAKYYLEDFAGSEEDATEALRLNPYLVELYDLRAMARVNQQNLKGAIEDFSKGLELDPSSKEFWYNRALCEYYLSNFSAAREQVDTINRRWSGFVNAYTLKAEILLQEKDTLSALSCLDKGLALNPYDAGIWYSKGNIHLTRREWKEAGLSFLKVVHFKPKHVPSINNLALCYLMSGNDNSAKAKYTLALEFDPNNFISHYNRGILNAHMGKFEEALMDFNFVLNLEPGNVAAQKNKELLLKKELHDTRNGLWSTEKISDLCYRNSVEPEKYASLILERPDEKAYNLEFVTEYNGNRKNSTVDLNTRSMFMLSYAPYDNGSQSYLAYDRDVEKFISTGGLYHEIYVACGLKSVSPAVMRESFGAVDSLTVRIDNFFEGDELERLYMQRAIAYSVVQNYQDAISDLNWVITLNPDLMIAYWQRGVCQTLLNGFNIAQGLDVKAKSASALEDINKALSLAGDNAYLYYNRAIIHAQNQEIGLAIEDYSHAVRIEPNMAEAYFNRGLLYLKQENHKSASEDLKKAGELGIKDALGILNRIGVAK